MFHKCGSVGGLSGCDEAANFFKLIYFQRDGDLGSRHTNYHTTLASGARAFRSQRRRSSVLLGTRALAAGDIQNLVPLVSTAGAESGVSKSDRPPGPNMLDSRGLVKSMLLVRGGTMYKSLCFVYFLVSTVASGAVITVNTLIGLNGTLPPGCAVSTVTSPGSSTSTTTSSCLTPVANAQASASGNGTNFSVSASVQAAATDLVIAGAHATARFVETYTVQGGSGLGVLELTFSMRCSGSNSAVFDGRPEVSISDGITTTTNPQGPCALNILIPFGSPLLFDFTFGATPITVDLSLGPSCCVGTIIESQANRSVTASVRILNSRSGSEVAGAFLVPIADVPEPGTWLAGLAVIAMAAGARWRR